MFRKRKIKRFFKKFLFLIPIFITVFSLFVVPVSAVTGTVFTVPISKPNVSGTFGYIEVLGQTIGGSSFVEVYLVNVMTMTDPDTTNLDVYVDVEISNNQLSISSFGSLKNPNPSVSIYCVSDTGGLYYWGWSDEHIIDFSYNILNVRTYGICRLGYFYNTSLASSNPFTVLYSEDSASYLLLQSILTVLNNQSNADIIASQNQNSQQIQQNANQNAEDIQENQNENTDKLLNGWESDEEVDSGGTSDLGSAESGLIDNNKDAASNEISNVNDNVFGSLQRLASSFGATGSLFRQLAVHVPDTSIFIYFSLAIGVVPLIVGMGINGLRASDRKSSQERLRNAYKSGYNSGYTKGKGG